jgi:hypothetical protein
MSCTPRSDVDLDKKRISITKVFALNGNQPYACRNKFLQRLKRANQRKSFEVKN